MKKLLSSLLAFLMLTSLISAFALTASAEEAGVTAKFYQVEADKSWLYVVFSEDMTDPVDSDMVELCLIGHGWPVTDEAGNKIYRHLVRTSFSDVEVVTPRVWRFSHRGSKTDAAKEEYVSWFMVNCINNENAPAEVQDWTARLFGTIRTAAGAELVMDETTVILDGYGMGGGYGPGYNLGEIKDVNKAATIFDLGVEIPTEETESTAPDTDKPADSSAAPDTGDKPADSASAEQSNKPAVSTDAPADDENSALIPIICVVAAVAVIAVVVIVILKKRKA